MQVARSEGAKVTVETRACIDGPGTTIGRYQLLELIGEGGMGLVYLAEQKEPVKRRVAFKIIKPGMDSKQVIARFEAERQALAVLDHPNIAHVFDAGCTETGRPYFVMEHVKGMSITRYCDENKLTIEQRLRLFEQVCEAVHHAHQKGIIHRDLKPSNILVSVHGDKPVPKIIDFGIAKAITSPLTDKTFVTFQGQLLGTPEYMSPEQVDLATQDIDTRSDIYSLGIVLYELLAGVLPFEEESFARAGLAEIQQTIREQEPTSPSIRLTNLGEQAKTIAASRSTQVVPLARRLHRELEWIPLKAMRKDRCRRYRSATEMADDIRNYLTGRPLIAGPETAIYRVQKFVRKHAGSVATVALVAVAIILGLAVSTAMYFKAEDSRRKEVVARGEAEQATKEQAAARAEAEQAREKEAEARVHAEMAEAATKEKAEELRRTLYVNTIQLAEGQYRDKNTKRAHELLQSCPENLRGWEWNRLNYISDQSTMTLVRQERGAVAAFSPDGKRIVSYGWGGTKICDAGRGTELMTLQEGAFLGAFSPDSKWMILGDRDGTMRVCDIATGEKKVVLRGHGQFPLGVAYGPDGKWIVSVGRDNMVRTWDAETGAESLSLNGPETTYSVAVSPTGDRIAAGGSRVLPSGHEEGIIKVWNHASGAELIGFSVGLDKWANRIVFSPDGKRIACCGGDATIQVWDAYSGTKVMTLTGHRRWSVYSVAFSPDGKRIVSGGRDQTVRVWNASTGTEEMVFQGHERSVLSVAFSPDGRRVASGSEDGTVKLWDIDKPMRREFVTLAGHKGNVASVAFSPDGIHLVSRSHDRTIKLWDVKTGVETKTLPGQYYLWASNVAFSPSGERIVSGHREEIRVWDAGTGKQLLSFRAHDDYVSTIAMSLDGKYIASGGGNKDGLVKVWDALTGKRRAILGGHKSGVCAIAFSPAGDRLASGGDEDGLLKIWDLTSDVELRSLKHGYGVFSIAFSPDGRHIASGGSDGDKTVKIWDTQTGAEVTTLHGHDSGVYSIAFSPDGRRILSGSNDETIRLWDVATGAEVTALPTQHAVWSGAFSPDGRTIAITDGNAVTLFESRAPGDEYVQREKAREARDIVDRWHTEGGSFRDVTERLLAEETLDEEVRRLAMQIADSRKWDDIENLRSEAWAAVLSSGKDIEAYRAALAKAEKANGWEPNDPAILDALGAAQYRTGAYEEALNTFARAKKLRADPGDQSDPASIAFTAMAQHQLGRGEEAKATLEQLRGLLKDERFAGDEEAKGLLAEADGLIAGKKP
jgi:WD40 repeat protein/tRNA A-37 threonylcarbamoyl transferase component Bud32